MYLYPINADPDAPDPRDFIDTCPQCEGTGWHEGRSHFAPASYDYCTCDTGQERRLLDRTRREADWQAANDDGLWDNPDLWPWI